MGVVIFIFIFIGRIFGRKFCGVGRQPCSIFNPHLPSLVFLRPGVPSDSCVLSILSLSRVVPTLLCDSSCGRNQEGVQTLVSCSLFVFIGGK